MVADARELRHHFLGILLRHLEIADGVEQVDVSHHLTATHIAVQRLHQLAGIEAVALAQVDEQSVVALLCLVHALLAVGLSLTLLSTLLLAHLLNFGGIGIVGKELSELARDNLLDDFFLVDILEVAVDVEHKRRDFIVVYVGFHDLVHHLVELLLADFLGRWNLRLLELLSYFLLDGTNLVLLLRVDNRDAGALLAGTSRAARAVGIVLDVVGHSEVDDVRQVVDVEATGCHVGSHEQLRQVLAELLHGQVALLLRQVTVQRLGVVAVLDELVGYLLRFYLRAAEDDGEDFGVVVHDALQCQVLVLCVHHVIDVVNVLGTLVARAHDDGLVVLQILCCHALHLAAHRGREHQRAVLFGQGLEDFVDTVREAHVEHLVGLVEHDGRHLLQMDVAAVLQVDESPWRGHNHLHALLQGTHLRLDGSTAVDGLHMDAVEVFAKVAQVVGNLQAQLTRGTQHQRLGVTFSGVNPLQQGNAEGCRLARTRLSQGDGVAPPFHQQGNDSFLYRHGSGKAKFFNGAQYGSTDA